MSMSNVTKTKACHNCIFFQDYDGESGECRRYAPRAELYGGDGNESPDFCYANWPMIHKTTWCGEFKSTQNNESNPIGLLGLSQRPETALCKANIRTVEELSQKTRSELIALPGFGMTSYRETMRKLSDFKSTS